MLSSMFETGSVPVLEQLVRFAQARHNILAGNIANLDTPGYRTRDLSVESFQARLKQAIDSRDSAAATLAGPGARRQNAVAEAGQRLEGILRHDETNVGLDQQIIEIAKNQSQHNLALSVLGNQFRLLGAAISERA